MSEIRIYNKNLRVTQIGTGEISIIVPKLEEMIDNHFLESDTIPSIALTSIVHEVVTNLGLTWENAQNFDTMDRTSGGAVAVTNVWREIE